MGSLKSFARSFLSSRPGMVITLVAAIVGSTAISLAGAAATGVIEACVNNSSGTIKIVSAAAQCANNEIRLVWNAEGSAGATGPTGPTGATGATGADGTFAGNFSSPNGLYSMQVTDSGIVLKGPGGTITLNALGTVVDTVNVQIRAAGTAELKGGVTFIGAGACAPAVRISDPALVSSGPDGGTFPVHFLSGSTSLIC
jgi:hypothetical protein